LTSFKHQHEAAKQAFQRIEEASPGEARPRVGAAASRVADARGVPGGASLRTMTRDSAADDTLASWLARHHQELGDAKKLVGQIEHRSRKDMRLPLARRLEAALDTHIQREWLEIRPRIERVWGAITLEEKGTVAGGRGPGFSAGCSSLAVNGGWGESVQTYTVDSSRRLAPQSPRVPIQITSQFVRAAFAQTGRVKSGATKPRAGLASTAGRSTRSYQARQERGGSGGPG
jgi:hypothetical protein